MRPLGVRGVEALVDHRRALGRVAGRIEVSGVRGPPVDTVGQGHGTAARYSPDIDTEPGQSAREREAHLPGAENDVQAALRHGGAIPARRRYVRVPFSYFPCWVTDLPMGQRPGQRLGTLGGVCPSAGRGCREFLACVLPAQFAHKKSGA